MDNISVHEIWEINYRGADSPKLFDWWAWEQAQKFANEVDTTTTVFYATGMTDTVNGRAYGTGRLYEETLTKDELAGVSREWIEERRRRLAQKYAKQD